VANTGERGVGVVVVELQGAPVGAVSERTVPRGGIATRHELEGGLNDGRGPRLPSTSGSGSRGRRAALPGAETDMDGALGLATEAGRVGRSADETTAVAVAAAMAVAGVDGASAAGSVARITPPPKDNLVCPGAAATR